MHNLMGLYKRKEIFIAANVYKLNNEKLDIEKSILSINKKIHLLNQAIHDLKLAFNQKLKNTIISYKLIRAEKMNVLSLTNQKSSLLSSKDELEEDLLKIQQKIIEAKINHKKYIIKIEKLSYAIEYIANLDYS
jgi:hypothetical protein